MIPDWCEPNYEWTFLVAEWWNTWSSIAYIALGALGAQLTVGRSRLGHMTIAYVMLIFVGIGSTLFHATLSRTGQILDEFSMILCVLSGLFCTISEDSEKKYAILFSVTVLASYFFVSFYVFAVSFGISLLSLLVRSLAIIGSHTPNPVTSPLNKVHSRRLVLAGVSLICVAFFFCWLPEHVLCVRYEKDERSGFIERVPLHAAWHILSSMGAYMWIAGAVIWKNVPVGHRVSPLNLKGELNV